MTTRSQKVEMFKNYGLGVGLRAKHLSQFQNPLTRPEHIKWVEVISENYMAWKSQENVYFQNTLLKVREHFPIALHGVSLNLGSKDPLNLDYLKQLKELAKRVQPIVISDHLCWTAVHGIQLHDLNPLPYTRALAKHVADKIVKAQDFLGRRILIENVSSYLTFEDSEMREENFICEIVEAADCGILLDINNVYVSSVNHEFDPKKFLLSIPRARVGQVHVAGHTREENGFLIDTHDHPVAEPVWELMDWYQQNFGLPSVMLERDANIPEWSEMQEELGRIQKILLSGRSSVKGGSA